MRLTLALFAVVLVGCSGAQPAAMTTTTEAATTTSTEGTTTPTEAATTTTEETTTTTEAAATGAVVSTAETDLGTVLVDGEGLTLYLLTADDQGESTCYDDCASAWPPLLTEGDPRAEGEADASLLGTTTREDGSLQVTYGGWPLYGFVQDAQPGDLNGQAITSFGGTWWVVGPDGEAIEDR